ncbi:alpha-endosulfine-like [Sycon ciliatum]|uniref:alpha-endosulfine-like n=1 Tax=Sycon ciliatum TaxID=27933 RepID=UPI0031F68FAB|eukprot:scpid11988/ scgid25011/ 
MADTPATEIRVEAPAEDKPKAASTDNGDTGEKQQSMKDQDAKLAAKYGGMNRPTASSIVQKRISRGGCQFFDSGDYNKNKKDGKSPAVAVGGGTTAAPLAVTPGGAVDPGVSNLTAIPKRMQRKPSGASRLGLPSHSPPKGE